MKKLLITSTIVALAMIGFVVVLCILPCNGGCCGKNNKECMISDGNGSCTMESDSMCGDGKMRKEIRVIMNDGHGGGNCQMNSSSCNKDRNSCSMQGGDHMMMGGMNGGCCCCCCCMMMMHGGGMGMCHDGGDSMKVMVKIDTLKKVKTK